MRAQDCRRPRRSAGPSPVVFVLLLSLMAAAPSTPARALLPLRPARRLFTGRAARERFALFAVSQVPHKESAGAPSPGASPGAPDQADRPDRPDRPDRAGRIGRPDHPGGVRTGVELPDGPLGLTVRVGHDLRDLVESPAHLSARGWGTLAGGALLVGLSHLADDDVRSSVRKESSDSRSWAKSIRPLGQEGGLALAALAWSIGDATGHREIAATAEDSLEATVVAAGIVAPLLKLSVGRDRPRSGQDSSSFSGGQAFPSGEVTQAFAMASVIAAHSRRPWVDALAWTGATAISWERLRLDAHWASDVAAGALIGAGIGRWVVRRNRPLETGRRDGTRTSFLNDWSVTPLVGQKDFGLGLRMVF